MINPIYAHPRIYETGLRILYRSRYIERLTAVAEEIPEGASVVDLCAGDCALYRYVLKQKKVDYLACDRNEKFLRWAENQGINTQYLNLFTDDVPTVDCVVLMGSLYQFYPNEQHILSKMIQSAREKVIVSEPIRNLSQSRFFLLKWLAYYLTKFGKETYKHRFNEKSLHLLLKEAGFHFFKPIAGGREILSVLEKSRYDG